MEVISALRTRVLPGDGTTGTKWSACMPLNPLSPPNQVSASKLHCLLLRYLSYAPKRDELAEAEQKGLFVMRGTTRGQRPGMKNLNLLLTLILLFETSIRYLFVSMCHRQTINGNLLS